MFTGQPVGAPVTAFEPWQYGMPQSMQRAACFLVSSSGSGSDELVPMLDARVDRLVVAVFAFVLEETGDLAHPPLQSTILIACVYSAACMVRAFAISASARLYSTGITLRNFGR